jgi:hypothetical protein
MLKFSGRVISGSHGPAFVGSPEQHVRRVKYWDLVGEAEVVGKPGGRVVTYDILLHDGYTQQSLIDELEILDDTVGDHGTLKETGNVTRTFKFCTFDGYELLPFGGQENTSMLQDVALTLRDDNGTVETQSSGSGGWFQHVRLMFRQLKV